MGLSITPFRVHSSHEGKHLWTFPLWWGLPQGFTCPHPRPRTHFCAVTPRSWVVFPSAPHRGVGENLGQEAKDVWTNVQWVSVHTKRRDTHMELFPEATTVGWNAKVCWHSWCVKLSAIFPFLFLSHPWTGSLYSPGTATQASSSDLSV